MHAFEDHLTRIRELLRDAPHGLTVTEIARMLGKNTHSVGRYMDILLVSGQVEMRSYGKAKVFTLSTRVPMDFLMGGIQDLILVLDADNRIVRINDQFLQLIKKTRPEISGKNLSYVGLSDPAGELIFTGIRSALDSGQFDTELSLKDRNNQVFRQKIIPAVFEDGRKGMIVLLENISERKAAEQALRTREEEFRLMADTIHDGMVICRNDTVTYANRRVEEIFGYPPEELSLLSPVEFAAPEEQVRVQEFLDALRTGGIGVREIALWIIRKDSHRRYISCRLTSHVQDGGTLRYLLITDMTGWKHAQDALENQLGFMQTMIDSFPGPLFYVDAQGRYLGCNAAFSSLTGRSIGELAGKTDTEITGPWPSELFGKNTSTLLGRQDTTVYKGTFLRADGTESLLTIRKSTLLAADGSVAGVVGIVLPPCPQ